MEQQKMIWLSTSLFSSKKNWNQILNDGIEPFVACNKLLSGYTLEFNYLSGENVRLALLTDEGNAEALSKNADSHFKNYFKKAALPASEIKLPVDGIFMPFLPNSIQYGLYPPQIVSANDLHKHAVSINLSKIMIAALQDEIDDETVITFAFYLQVALIKAVFNVLNDVDTILSIINSGSNQNSDKKTEGMISNEDLMEEIALDVIQNDEFDSELSWLNDWIDGCKASLTAIDNTNNERNLMIRNFYHNHAGIIYNHLGINAEGRNLLFYLINRSLGKYFKVIK